MKFFQLTLMAAVLSTNHILAQNTPLAITIDDMPGITGLTGPNILIDVNDDLTRKLEANKWPATVFVNEGRFYEQGRLDSAKLSILSIWLSRGFEIGNHTYSHINYHTTDTTTYFQDIMKGEILSRKMSAGFGTPFRYFRHPYLRNGMSVEKKSYLKDFLRRNDYVEAPVTIDNSDWIYSLAYDRSILEKNETLRDSIATSYIRYMVAMSNHYRRKATELVGRDISHVLLIHVRKINADLIEDLITALEKENFEIAPLEDVLSDPVYQLEDGYFGSAGISWVERWAMAKDKPDSFYSDIPRCPEFIQEYAERTE